MNRLQAYVDGLLSPTYRTILQHSLVLTDASSGLILSTLGPGQKKPTRKQRLQKEESAATCTASGLGADYLLQECQVANIIQYDTSRSQLPPLLPLSLTHADVNDPDVLAFAAEAADSKSTKPSDSQDDWDWNDEMPSASSTLKLDISKIKSKPVTKLVHPTKLSFVLNCLLTKSIILKLAEQITQVNAAGKQYWKEIHIFTSMVNGTEDDSYEALEEQFQAHLRQLQSQFKIEITLHYFPFVSMNLNSNAFLTPISLQTDSTTLSTYPPSLHLTSTSAAPIPKPNTAAGPTTDSSPTGLLSTFSISNLTKGLSDHIKEAEQIAMQGVDSSELPTTTTHSSSNKFRPLATALTHALTQTLFAMKLQPDIFAVGHRTTKLGHKIMGQLQRLKEESSAAAPQQQTNPWTSASLILLDRSLDLVSVTKHHSIHGIRDRAHDFRPSGSRIEDLRSQLFSTKPIPSNPPNLANQRDTLFPPPLTNESLSLLHAISELSTSSNAMAITKSVLTTLLKHLHQLTATKPTITLSSNANQLIDAIRIQLNLLNSHPHLSLQHRQLLDLSDSILQSYSPNSPTSVPIVSKQPPQPVMYDRLLKFEELLLMQYIANTSSASTTINISTNPNEDTNTLALKGLIEMTIEFIRNINQPDEPERDQARLTLFDISRLLVYLYSLVGGRHLIPESDTKKLQALFLESIEGGSEADCKWLRQTCHFEEEGELSSTMLLALVTAFFQQLQGVSLARSNLTASDLIDLTTPAESSDEQTTSTTKDADADYRPFVARLLHRIQSPDCLLDDLEHLPWIERDEKDNAESKNAEENNPNSNRSNKSSGPPNTTRQPSASPSNAAASLQSLTSDSSATSGSGGGGWGFLNSLATAVSSVTNSTSLRGLGFGGRVIRPNERPVLILFIVGGITHEEVSQLQQSIDEWRQTAIEEEKAQGGDGSIAAEQEVLIGSTHIATAEELIRQLLGAAADQIRLETNSH